MPPNYKVESLRLKDRTSLMPSFQLLDERQSREELRFGAVTTRGDKLVYGTKTGTISGVENLLVVLGEREAAFIHTAGTLMEPAQDCDLVSTRDGSRKFMVRPGKFSIDPLTLKPGRYQVRIVALGKENKPLGYFSFPHDIIYKPGGFFKDAQTDSAFERLLYENRPDKP